MKPKPSKSGKRDTKKPRPTSSRSKPKPNAVKHKTSDTIRALLIALFAALVLRQFVIASYNVPTGSMKDTILVGDFMFVNKFIYGARSPLFLGIPFTDIGTDTLPSWLRFQLPAITEPKEREIIVFDYPLDRKIDYIKRCVAVGGQTVEVKNDLLFVNGQPEGKITQTHVDTDPYEMPNEVDYKVQYTDVDAPHGKHYTIRHFTEYYDRRRYPRKWMEFRGNDNFPLTRVPQNSYSMTGDNRDNSADSRQWGFVRRDHVGGKPLMIWLSVNWHVKAHQFYEAVRWNRLGKVIQ